MHRAAGAPAAPPPPITAEGLTVRTLRLRIDDCDTHCLRVSVSA